MRQSNARSMTMSFAAAGWVSPAGQLRLSGDFWDIVIRIAAGAFFASLAASYLSASIQSLPELGRFDLRSVGWLSIAAIGAFYTTVTLLVVVRAPPRAKARGIVPRLVAIVGSYVLGAYALFPRHPELPPLLQAMSAVLVLAGTAASVWVLIWLGRSFSVMAEARQLVTAGPYRFVRHPLYLAEMVSTCGIFIAFASPWTATILALQIGLQLRRMQNEERVLAAAFADYGRYAAGTRRLIPGIW